MTYLSVLVLVGILSGSAALAENVDMEIRQGTSYTLNSSIDVAKLTINGTLKCAPSFNGEIRANVIYVNGTLECGTILNPFQGNLKISLKHSAEELASGAYRGFIVNKGGVLRLHGNNIKAGFSKLNQTAGANSSTLTLSEPRGWVAGDRIVVASTSYNPFESEDLFIQSLSGTQLTLNRPLQFRHHGETQVYFTQVGNKLLDERAEVANLTRNILIQGEGAISNELGGHVMVMKGGAAYIDSVEFFQMGHAGFLGRYPFHWHLVGNARGQYIRNSSIHQSFQRCVVIHQTNQAEVSDNVCFSYKGHGFMLEDGNEVNNTLNRNLAILAQFPSDGKALRISETRGRGTPLRFPAVSSFWISHPTNRIVNNIASGSVGTGFWNSFLTNQDTTDFSGNVAHTTLVGMTWDGAEPLNKDGTNSRDLINVHYSPRNIPQFSELQAFKNIQAGVYFRGGTALFNNCIFEGNGWSLFLAYNQIIKNSLVIGEYRGNSAGISRLPEYVGIVLYDGPFELDTVDFHDFHFDTPYKPIRTIGGHQKFINVSKKLSFYPEPQFRVFHRDMTDRHPDRIGENWMDFVFTNAIRDLDGTLTGAGPGIVIPSAQIYSHAGCRTDRFYGMMACPSNTRLFIAEAQPNLKMDVIFGLVRTDGKSQSLDLPENWSSLISSNRYLNRKALMVANSQEPNLRSYRFHFDQAYYTNSSTVTLMLCGQQERERSPEIFISKTGSTKSCGTIRTDKRSGLVHKNSSTPAIWCGTLNCSW